MQYRPEIDGLRAVAVLAVLFFHAGVPLFAGGFVGVDVFFVISGYVITAVVLRDRAQDRFRFLAFYQRRIRRLAPALLALILVCMPCVALFLSPPVVVGFAKSVLANLALLPNMFFWAERGYFDVAAIKPLLHTWSLGVEAQFYFLYPVIFSALYRFGVGCLRAGVLWFGVLSFLLCCVASLYDMETGFYVPVMRGWEFCIGAWAAFSPVRCADKRSWLGGLGLAFICVSAMFCSAEWGLFPGPLAVFPCIGAYLAVQHCAAKSGGLTARPLRFLGRISYSVYLWHYPVFLMLHVYDASLLMFACGFVLVFAVSYVSYRWCEQPFRQGRVSMVWCGALCGCALLFSVVLLWSKGWVSRYALDDRRVIAQFDGHEAYVQGGFDARNAAEFAARGRRVFLIGDSYAKDIFNLVSEGAGAEAYSVVTQAIHAPCGHGFGGPVFASDVPLRHRLRCYVMGRYQGLTFMKRAVAADEIWLASRWSVDTVATLPFVIAALQHRFNARVRVFGLKEFGRVSLPMALAVPSSERAQYRQPVSQHSAALNAQMRTVIGDDVFVDMLAFVCGERPQTCMAFTPDGALVSYDGEHLTQAGVRFLSARFMALLADDF